MLYRVLRENIESGPFTKEEMIAQGLLPSDQIKLDGDLQWSPITAFSEFKDIVAHLHKPKFKITADKKIIEVKEDLDKKEPANETPFKRIPSAVPKNKNYTSNKKNAAQPNIEPSAPSYIEDLAAAPTLEEKRKKKLTPIASKNKHSSSSLKKELIIPILILAAVGFIGWKVYSFFTHPTNKEAVVLQTTIPTIDSGNANTAKDSTVATKVSTAAVAQTKPKLDSAAHPIKKDSANSNKFALTKDSASNKVAKKNVDTTKLSITTPALKNNIAKLEKPATSKTDTPAKKEDVKPKRNAISSYVTLSLSKKPEKEVRNIKLWVSNISKQHLNIVVIDLKYLDKTGKMISGETLQAENIDGGESKMIRVPNNRNATKLSYHVSLISGDKIYLMAH